MFARSLLLSQQPLHELASPLRRTTVPASASLLQSTVGRRSFASCTSLASRIRPTPPKRLPSIFTHARDNSAPSPQNGHVSEDDLIPFDFDMPSSTDPSPPPAAKAQSQSAPPKSRNKLVGRKDAWKLQKQALKQKFPEGWKPRRLLSPDAMDVIRHVHSQDPALFSTPVLAHEFKVSPEAIRRVLKSKWRPTPERMHEKREKYRERKARIWNQMAAIGLRPPKEGMEEFSDERILDNGKD